MYLNCNDGNFFIRRTTFAPDLESLAGVGRVYKNAGVIGRNESDEDCQMLDSAFLE
jgi:hypothetical protein